MRFGTITILILAILAVSVSATAADATDPMNAAGALYSQSVDLANEGKYQQALDAADKALAMNVTAFTGLIQSNRAGILVMLNRNDEAVTAADAALAVEGNLTTVHSIAWYNKGNALKNLGRTAEAKDAYDHAYALDKTLVPPDLGTVVPSLPVTTAPAVITPSGMTVAATIPQPSPTKSPLPLSLIIGAVGIAGCILVAARRK